MATLQTQRLSLGPLGPAACPICATHTRLKLCSGCKAISYCSVDHQTKHRPSHKNLCKTIKAEWEILEKDGASTGGSEHGFPFDEDGKQYMSVRAAYLSTLLAAGTTASVETALRFTQDVMAASPTDKKYTEFRDLVPFLLLRLGQEQECYDFIKWWANAAAKYDGRKRSEYLNIRGADACERLDKIQAQNLSFSQLLALTLLKVRIWLDFSSIECEMEPGIPYEYEPCPADRPIGKIAKARIADKRRALSHSNMSNVVDSLEKQHAKLCHLVHARDPEFWDDFINMSNTSPGEFGQHARAVIDCVVARQTMSAWIESEDAILMADSTTAALVHEYIPDGLSAHQNDQNGHNDSRICSNMEAATLENRKGTGAVFPTIFTPQPALGLADIFTPQQSSGNSLRLVSKREFGPRKVLVFVDGSCMGNGGSNSRGGWAVVYGAFSHSNGDVENNDVGLVSGQLEDKGPTGQVFAATSNRAELRSAIAALRLSNWHEEGFSGIVIATDSTYVVDGATAWTRSWLKKGWLTKTSQPVKNRDLWEILLGEVERCAERKVSVQFCKISREDNALADAAAKKAASALSPTAPSRDVTTQCGMLLLCIDNMSLAKSCFGDFLDEITSRCGRMDRAETPETALAMLARKPIPSVILIADAGPSRNRAVWDRVIDCLRAGSTVILMGLFSSMITPGEFIRFCSCLGLSWRIASYHRTDIRQGPGLIGDGLSSRLCRKYSAKSNHIMGMDPSCVWYADENTPNEAAIVLTPVGAGRLGYVGDVNSEDETHAAILAMCGLLGDGYSGRPSRN